MRKRYEEQDETWLRNKHTEKNFNPTGNQIIEKQNIGPTFFYKSEDEINYHFYTIVK